jgi:glycosyltransferase involved in cell wall biosynthesis
MTRISVVIPTRERLPQLRHALAGVDAQGWPDLEVIVVVDGSSDGTADHLREARPEVRLLVSPVRVGAAAARNLGLEQATGELVAFLDDDDLWRPGYLATQVASLTAHVDALLGYTGHVEVDRAGRVTCPDTSTLLRDATPLARMLAECFVHTMSVVVCRREALERFGTLDPGLAIVHDLDWYARILGGGGRIAYDPRPLVERGLPGGLITSHHDWHAEERIVLDRWPEVATRKVRAYRSLTFAGVGVSRRDPAFAVGRAGEALALAPLETARLSLAALARRRRRLSAPPADPAMAVAGVEP